MNRLTVVSAVVQTGVCTLVLFYFFRTAILEAGTEAFGHWALLNALMGLIRIAELGTPSAMVMAVAIARADRNTGKVSAFLGSTVLWCVLVQLALSAIIFACSCAFVDASRHPQIAWTLMLIIATSVAWTLGQFLVACTYSWANNLAQALSAILCLPLAAPLLRAHGITGLAAVLCAQQVGTALLCGLFSTTIGLHSRPTFRAQSLRELFASGIPLQVVSLSKFAYDPLVKGLFAWFGSGHAVAVYEIASRPVLAARQILATSAESLIPLFAVSGKGSQPLSDLPRIVAATMVFSAWGCACLIAATPLYAHLMFAQDDAQLIFFMSALSISWSVNAVTIPTYNAAIATNSPSHNLIAHGGILASTIALCPVLGLLMSDVGIVLGWSISVALGSLWGAHSLCRRHCVRLAGILVDGVKRARWTVVLLAFAIPTINLVPFDSLIEKSALLLLVFALGTFFAVFQLKSVRNSTP